MTVSGWWVTPSPAESEKANSQRRSAPPPAAQRVSRKRLAARKAAVTMWGLAWLACCQTSAARPKVSAAKTAAARVTSKGGRAVAKSSRAAPRTVP